MLKKIALVLFATLILLSAVGCSEGVPEGNITFNSLEEMQEHLNGKWFSSDSLRGASYRYSEVIIDNDKITECFVLAGVSDKDGYDKFTHNDNYKFEDFYYSYESPKFKYNTGQIFAGESDRNINIKDGYLKIGNRVYYKASNKTDVIYENFETFQDFCEFSLHVGNGQIDRYNSNCRFVSMIGYKKGEKDAIFDNPDEDETFLNMGCDENNISFELTYDSKTHFFGTTAAFAKLYNEQIKEVQEYRRTHVIALIGTKMPDFNKKDTYNNDEFFELDYYLYMNSDGKLISNI